LRFVLSTWDALPRSFAREYREKSIRIGLPAAIAAAVLSCGLSAPANATSFTFDIDHPVTVTTVGRTFSYSYFAKSIGAYSGLGIAKDALFEVQVRYFDETRNEFVPNFSGGGSAYSSENTPLIDYTNVNYGDYDGRAQFFLTFKTVSDQKVLISDLEGYEYPQMGGPGSSKGFNVLPEPGTWLLMVTGFGLIGATARRRKPAVAVSYG
jgi:hypothetical protein